MNPLTMSVLTSFLSESFFVLAMNGTLFLIQIGVLSQVELDSLSDFNIITASLVVIGLLRPESKTGNDLFPS